MSTLVSSRTWMVNILLHLVTMSVWRSTMTTSKGHEYLTSTLELATRRVFWTGNVSYFLNNVFMILNPTPTNRHETTIASRNCGGFKGKVILMIGWTKSWCRRKPGVNSSADVSVPINWAYNHHYMLWMTGSDSEMKYVKPQPGDVSAHGAPLKWKAVDKPSAKLRDDPSIPTSQLFSEGNGGESRKSFHGYPNGYAQLIESPNLWHITPMQIDTRNRDCGVRPEDVKNCTTFTPGPEPKQARYGEVCPKTRSTLVCWMSGPHVLGVRYFMVKTKQDNQTSYEMIPFGSRDWGEGCHLVSKLCPHIDTTRLGRMRPCRIPRNRDVLSLPVRMVLRLRRTSLFVT